MCKSGYPSDESETIFSGGLRVIHFRRPERSTLSGAQVSICGGIVIHPDARQAASARAWGLGRRCRGGRPPMGRGRAAPRGALHGRGRASCARATARRCDAPLGARHQRVSGRAGGASGRPGEPGRWGQAFGRAGRFQAPDLLLADLFLADLLLADLSVRAARALARSSATC